MVSLRPSHLSVDTFQFSSYISWSRGSSIGWHSDDNRPYLKQRHFAVCIQLCENIHVQIHSMQMLSLTTISLATCSAFVAVVFIRNVVYGKLFS